MGIPMRLIRSFFLFLSVILLGAGCGSGRKSGEGAGEAFRIEYARHYRVEHFRDYTLVDVLSPWDSLRLLRRYVLVDRERPLPVGLPEGNIVRTPLQRVVVYSAVHCGMLDELGVGDRIVGASPVISTWILFATGWPGVLLPTWARLRRRMSKR